MIEPLYIIKASSLLIVLLVYYRWFIQKNTFFSLNRTYLLTALLLATIIPHLHFTISLPEKSNILFTGIWEEFTITNISDGGTPKEYIYLSTLKYIYLFGILFLSVRLLFSMLKVLILYLSNPHKKADNIHIVRLKENLSTFSFGRYIFFNEKGLDNKNRKEILEHEMVHIRQCHSLDMIVAEIICILNWYNPLFWIFKKLISDNHEYIADYKMIHKYQTGRYLELLINQTLQGKILPLGNSFSCSNLKKRMIMMTKQQTAKNRILNYIPILIISISMSILFSCNREESPSSAAIQEEKIIGNENVILNSPEEMEEDPVFMIVEEAPQFSGDIYTWLKDNMQYPADAVKRKIEGRVFVKFIIEKDGSVTNVELARGIESLLDEEAIKVVTNMPKWIPGTQRGKAVRVAYTLPILFKLQ